MNKLDEKSDEAHDEETHARRGSDLSEFFAVWFRAHVDQHLALLGELPERVDDILGDRVFPRRHL